MLVVSDPEDQRRDWATHVSAGGGKCRVERGARIRGVELRLNMVDDGRCRKCMYRVEFVMALM